MRRQAAPGTEPGPHRLEGPPAKDYPELLWYSVRNANKSNRAARAPGAKPGLKVGSQAELHRPEPLRTGGRTTSEEDDDAHAIGI